MNRAPTRSAKVTTIATLRAEQSTSLYVAETGNIYYVQHDPAETDIVYTIGGDGVPKRTSLDAQAICTALGHPEGRGQIQSLVVLRSGELVAYFSGGTERTPLVAIVTTNNAGGRLRVLADTGQIATQTGFGRSLELGEGLLALAGDQLFLWLRHPSGHQFYRVQPAAEQDKVLTRAFNSIVGQLSGEIRFNDPSNRFTGDADGSLWVVAPRNHALFRINTQGEITGNRAAKEVPTPRTAPIHRRDRNGKLEEKYLYFCGRDDVPVSTDNLVVVEEDPHIAFPLLVQVDANRRILWQLDMHEIEFRPLFPAYALRIENLALDPITGNLVAYDAMSGELLRIAVNGG